MNTLLWQLRQWARRLGATGLAGLALLAAALLLQLIQVAPLQRDTARQNDRLASLRLRAATPAANLAPTPANPLDLLPPAESVSQQIGELERLARAHGFQLQRGQYSVTSQAGSPLQRWQLVLPVETSYPVLHAFLATALERMPNLSLDEFKLKRDRIESTQLQAELRLSLFVEAAP